MIEQHNQDAKQPVDNAAPAVEKTVPAGDAPAAPETTTPAADVPAAPETSKGK
ncbi:MAG: hypothetical protein R3E67_08420 [Pseudomonadales bacterium]